MATSRQLVESMAARLWPNDPDSQRWFTALAAQESGFNPGAVPPGNPADVYGLFQFGPELRRQYGLTPNSTPEAQVAAAGDYLHGLWTKHSGDWNKVLAEHYLGLPQFNMMEAGGTNPNIVSFETKHLPAVEGRFASLGGTMPTDNTPLPGLGGGPVPTIDSVNTGSTDAGTGTVDPATLRKLLEMLAALQSQQQNQQGALNPIATYAGSSGYNDTLRALMGLRQATGPMVDPRAQLNSLYPSTGMPGGPQSGYIQWLGGSLQNPEPNATALAAAGLVQNALSGWMDSQRQGGQGNG